MVLFALIPASRAASLDGLCHNRSYETGGDHLSVHVRLDYLMQAVIEKLRGLDVGHQLEVLIARLAVDQVLKRIQMMILLLLAVWIAASVASLLWSLWSGPTASEQPAVIINPPGQIKEAQKTASVNLESMLGLGLFGDPIATADEIAVQAVEVTERDGIERGARETRLDLVLVGTLVTSRDGLGTAVIEARKEQVTYAVGDALPVAANVTLAKVLPKQVVLDNAGKFELLTLFEENSLAGVVGYSESKTVAGSTQEKNLAQAAPRDNSSPDSVVVNSAEATAMASRYRERIYAEPESLAKAVKVNAVSNEDGIYGYRVAPGTDAKAFETLGFQSGDIVTAVNGLDLGDPANTISLYQTMRDATEATFDIQRGESSLTLSVSLGQLQ